MAIALERLPEVRVVLDDAVVDDRDGLRAVTVRVRILVRGPAVSRPARVGHAQPSLQGLARQDALEGGDLPHAPAHLEAAVVDHRDARRVVAPILEPPEPVHEDRDGALATDVADDSTHWISRLSCSLSARHRTIDRSTPQSR